MNNRLSNQRLAQVQSQSVQPQLTPHPHTEPQLHVVAQEQGAAQLQPVDFVLVVFASFVVVVMRYLVFGLTG